MEQFFRHVFFDLGGDGLVDFSASTGETEGKVLDGEWVPWPFVDDAFGGIVRPVYVPRGGCCVLFFYVFPGVVGLVGVIATCCFEAPLWNGADRRGLEDLSELVVAYAVADLFEHLAA